MKIQKSEKTKEIKVIKKNSIIAIIENGTNKSKTVIKNDKNLANTLLKFEKIKLLILFEISLKYITIWSIKILKLASLKF